MSATVILDDDVAARLEDEVRRRGGTLKEAVNELLREGLHERSEGSETSPELMAQIREGYEEYQRGELRPIEEFMAELEAELANEQEEGC